MVSVCNCQPHQGAGVPRSCLSAALGLADHNPCSWTRRTLRTISRSLCVFCCANCAIRVTISELILHNTCDRVTYSSFVYWGWLIFINYLNWEKGKPSVSIACMGKQQPRFNWSCSSVVMKDATPLTPLAHERNSIFKWKQHTIHDTSGPELSCGWITVIDYL